MVDWDKWNSKNNQFEKTKNINSNLLFGIEEPIESNISIIILTYHKPKTFVNALKSAINQDYDKKYKIIIIDDYPIIDESVKIARKEFEKNKNIVYYKNSKNLGQYDAWNRAVKLCKTKWFCLLHDDDMLEKNYLSKMSDAIENVGQDAGLIGSYFHVIDNRNNSDNKKLMKHKKLIDRFVDFFIKVRNGAIIQIKNKDNLKLIYPLSCCLMINKELVEKIGGLNSEYYPSSDFVLASKMAYYYKTFFLPEYLSLRGIGDNESLKIEVCNGAIECAYYHTLAMSKSLKKSNCKKHTLANRSSVYVEIGVKGYHDVDYSVVKEKLGVPKIYNNKIVINLLNIYNKICWGLLLFR